MLGTASSFLVRGEHPHESQRPPGPHTAWRCVAWLRWVTRSGPTVSHSCPRLASRFLLGKAERRVSLLYPIILALQRGQLEEAQRGKCGQGKMSQLEGTQTTATRQGAADAPGRAVTPSLLAFLHPLLSSVSIRWDLCKLPKTTGLPLFLKKYLIKANRCKVKTWREQFFHGQKGAKHCPSGQPVCKHMVFRGASPPAKAALL